MNSVSGRVRHCCDDEVGLGQTRVKLGRCDDLAVDFVRGARIDADHSASKRGAQPSRLGADAANAVDPAPLML